MSRSVRGRFACAVWLVVAMGVGTGAYTYVMLTANLPEEMWQFVGCGVVVGLAVGRWWSLAGALATWSLSVEAETGVGEVTEYVLGVYMPLAVLSIAAGVALRKLLRRLGAINKSSEREPVAQK